MTAPALTTAERGFRVLAARRPLTVFIGLVLGFGWAIMSLMVLTARGHLSLGGLPPEIFILLVNLGVMLPAALWVTSATDGKQGVRALLARSVRWRFPALWWAIVLFAMPALTFAVAFLSGARFVDGHLAVIVLKQLGSTAIAILVIHLWEETVWGGFLQTRLEHRTNFYAAAALTALPFAGVHIPLLLTRPQLSVSTFLVDLGGLLLLAVVGRMMWGTVLRGARDSTLAIGVMHGVFNASNNPGQLVDSLVTGANVNQSAVIALLILTTGLVVTNRARLAQRRPLRPVGP